MIYPHLAKNIQETRKKIGLTQKELAKKIMKSEISIRKYESGKINIPPSTLMNLCKVFNISPLDLLGDDAKAYLENTNSQSLEMDFFDEISNTTLNNIDTIKYKLEELGVLYKASVTTPEGLLFTIVRYLANNELYFTNLNIKNKNTPQTPELMYFKETDIKHIVKKICDLTISEISNIENFYSSLYDETYTLTKNILNHKNLELTEEEFKKLYRKFK